MDAGVVARATNGREGGDEVKLEGDLRGRDFHHPFTPYRIQEEFMETVYRVLEGGGGRVGILESPTGTVGVPFTLTNSSFLILNLDWFLLWT
jgi:hypothetical protein